MAKDLKVQAEAVLKKHIATGLPKAQVGVIGETPYKQFTSIRSYKESAATLARIANTMGVDKLKNIDIEKAQDYLIARKEQERANRNILHVENKSQNSNRLVTQKTLDAERKALSILIGKPIPRVYSSSDSSRGQRAYTDYQVNEIAKSQSPRNALATKIAHASGLRAKELLQIRRASELSVTSGRKWHKDRFSGLNGEKYVVIGKGGLIREIIIPTNLAKQLETRRLDTPMLVTDRGVKYQSFYDIGGGNAFSKSYSDASKRTLNFSNGAHGLRHQYAQSRMTYFKSQGYSDKVAKTLTSQELGHFRASITNVYLR